MKNLIELTFRGAQTEEIVLTHTAPPQRLRRLRRFIIFARYVDTASKNDKMALFHREGGKVVGGGWVGGWVANKCLEKPDGGSLSRAK